MVFGTLFLKGVEMEKIVEESMASIDKTIKSVSMKDAKLKDITIRVGSKVLKYECVSSNNFALDDEIREEYSKLLSDKMKEIKYVINAKFNDTLRSLQTAKDEYTRKEQILLDRIKKAVPMPDVTMAHARRGLSIIKGERTGEIVWLIRRTYWPKTFGSEQISQSFIEKFITPIYIMVVTMDNKVTNVTTRKLGGLELFNHYHQANPDCWGRWSYMKNWSTPDDIIQIADEAEAVLENVNPNSIARHEPLGLPTVATLKRHLVKEKPVKPETPKPEEITVVIQNQLNRIGTGGAEDIWSV